MIIFNFYYWLLYFSFNPSNDYDYNYDDNDDNIMMIIIHHDYHHHHHHCCCYYYSLHMAETH